MNRPSSTYSSESSAVMKKIMSAYETRITYTAANKQTKSRTVAATLSPCTIVPTTIPAATPNAVPENRERAFLSVSPEDEVPLNTTKAVSTAQYQRCGESKFADHNGSGAGGAKLNCLPRERRQTPCVDLRPDAERAARRPMTRPKAFDRELDVRQLHGDARIAQRALGHRFRAQLRIQNRGAQIVFTGVAQNVVECRAPIRSSETDDAAVAGAGRRSIRRARRPARSFAR